MLKEALIKEYGTQIEKDLDIILEKISVTVAAHIYANNRADNPLSQLNRAFGTILIPRRVRDGYEIKHF